MATTLAFDARCAQQEALTAVSDALDGVDVGKDAYLYTFDKRRQRMTQVLTTYQTFKHNRIYDRAIAGSDAGEASKARDLKVACIATGEQYQAFVRAWPVSRITDEWDDYRAAVRLAESQLRRRMLEEADQINEMLGPK